MLKKFTSIFITDHKSNKNLEHYGQRKYLCKAIFLCNIILNEKGKNRILKSCFQLI